MNKKSSLGIALVTAGLVAVSVFAIVTYRNYREANDKNAELLSQLHILSEKEKQAVVDRHVSSQMEDIAYQQKEISDEQREKAIQQTQIANEMRAQSEVARQNALEAERQAKSSQAQAIAASKQANQERLLANDRRLQAEHNKRIADTLSYLAMARNMGSASITQYQAGNYDLAALLAYGAYHFTRRYQGDTYYPTIFQAISLSMGGNQSWALHKGMITDIAVDPNNATRFVTASTYGQVNLNTFQNNKLTSKSLINSKQYDFRDVHVGRSGTIYAVSKTGHILIFGMNNANRILYCDKIGALKAIHRFDSNTLVVVGEKGIATLDVHSQSLGHPISVDQKIILSGMKGANPMLFTERGVVYRVDIHNRKAALRTDNSIHANTTRLTAFAYSDAYHVAALGKSNGTIELVWDNGRQKTILGHRSRISQLTFRNQLIFAASYDGKASYTPFMESKADLMQVYTSKRWVGSFSLDITAPDIWTGDNGGILAQTTIVTTKMVERLHRKLKRNLTIDEWNYYIGRNIPYEKWK